MVIPAWARSRLASVSARSTSPFPMCPVGGVNVAVSPEPVSVTVVPLRSPCCRLVKFEPENTEALVAELLVVAVVVAPLEPVVVALVSVLLLPTILLLPVIVTSPVVVLAVGVVLPGAPMMKISISFTAVALAVLVLLAAAVGAVDPLPVGVVVGVVLDAVVVVVGLPVPLTAILVVDVGDVVVGLDVPLTAMLVDVGAVVVVVLGAAVVVGLVVLVVPPDVVVVVGLVVPLAAVPDPLTVDALTVVEPEAFTLPEPVLLASTVVDPEALVVVDSVVGLVVPLVLVLSVGAAVPLAAVPEPLTVEALTVVDPAALTVPEPLLVALTVVEPAALVSVVCAKLGPPSARPSRPALTAAAIVLLGCRIFIILSLLSVSPIEASPKQRGGRWNESRRRQHRHCAGFSLGHALLRLVSRRCWARDRLRSAAVELGHELLAVSCFSCRRNRMPMREARFRTACVKLCKPCARKKILREIKGRVRFCGAAADRPVAQRRRLFQGGR